MKTIFIRADYMKDLNLGEIHVHLNRRSTYPQVTPLTSGDFCCPLITFANSFGPRSRLTDLRS